MATGARQAVPDDSNKLKEFIRRQGKALGFSAVGFCDAEPLEEERARLNGWLNRGFHGGMDWMQKRAAIRTDPKAYFPEARSIVVVALNYFQAELATPTQHHPRISIYAAGRDYHKVMRSKLKQLLQGISGIEPSVRGRICVDSFPLMEKAVAVKAGLGWVGKHTNLIRKGEGSYFFLGELLLSMPLPPDEPFRFDHCGTCSRCQTACPTDALTEAYVLDARRCISYLTIEHHGDIDETLLPGIGNWVFGCDICQEVCPWTRFSEECGEIAFKPQRTLSEQTFQNLLKMSEADFLELFSGTAIMRAGYNKFKRNVERAWRNVQAGSCTQPPRDE